MKSATMDENMIFRTPSLSLAEVEDKMEELDACLTEVALKLQLMKDRVEMEDRTEELRRELAELRRQLSPLPPVEDDLRLIGAGLSPGGLVGSPEGGGGQRRPPAGRLFPPAEDRPNHARHLSLRIAGAQGYTDTCQSHRGGNEKINSWRMSWTRTEEAEQASEAGCDGRAAGQRGVRGCRSLSPAGAGPRRIRRRRLGHRAASQVVRAKRRPGERRPEAAKARTVLLRRASARAPGQRQPSKPAPAKSSQPIQTELKGKPDGASPGELPDETTAGPERGVASSGGVGEATGTAIAEGTLVWAKLGNSKWWPGMLINGDRAGQMTKRHPWVYWFGDHRVSEVALDRVREFASGVASCIETDCASKAYQLGLVEVFRECRRRLGLDPMAGSFRQVISWGRDNVRDPITLQDCSIPSVVLSHLELIRKTEQGERSWRQELAPRPAGSSTQPPPGNLRAAWVSARPPRLEAVCLACGSDQVISGHPLFAGGVCAVCADSLRDTMFALADDDISPYCVVCAQTGSLLICEETACNRGYCAVCLSTLVSKDAPQRLAALPAWCCPMCDITGHKTTLLKRRPDWKHQVIRLFTPSCRPALSLPSDQFSDRRPIRVLSLFDGIGTGMHVLSQLGMAVDVYLALETDPDAINVTAMNYPQVSQLGSVETLSDLKIAEVAPIDLVLGGSPCVDLSLVNPARRGLFDPDGTGILFFDFYRILRSVEVANRGRHVFWLFENVASMPVEYKKIISRFLQMEPALIDAKHFSAQSRPRFFWGNIPGLHSPLPSELLQSDHSIASCLVLSSRQPLVSQVGCVTTSRNSLKQGRFSVSPVIMNGTEDVMWITEIEQMFGLPRHYTDLGSLGPQRRQQLLGRAWSAPVIRHILTSLTPFFARATRQTP